MFVWLKALYLKYTRGVPVDVAQGAVFAHHRWKVPASVTIAQWALESGWGASIPAGSNNPFGIKAGPGEPFVASWTTEDYNGKVVRVIAKFRKYVSIAQAFDEHGELLATHYPTAMAHAAAPILFAYALTGHYATDPKYGSKLVQIMQQNNLFKYDSE